MALMITKKDDHEIHRDVLEELRWDTRVEETEVGVEVDAGLVTLTGTVTSYAKKLAAVAAAHRVAGVLDVVDDVKVKLPACLVRTDADIAHAVRHALDQAGDGLFSRVQATVEHGWVVLAGEVPHGADRHEAGRRVSDLTGVTGLTLNVAVTAPPVEAHKVRQAILGALNRHAHREAAHIKVTVDGAWACLSGPVRSWAEKQAILGAAGHAPGIETVEDRLYIDPMS